jgi:hypothetical protein
MRCLIQGGYDRHSIWHTQHRIERWIFMGKPEGNKPLQRPWHRWEDIKMPLMLAG